MEKIRLTDISHPYFAKAWALYGDAFPLDERRSLNSQTSIMSHPNYHLELIFQDDCFLGILFWWGFVDLRYIEHFATLPDHRGKGYGKDILHDFKQRDSRFLVLEVELPVDEINKRRIQFYKRLGFYLTDHLYYQPAYREGGLPIQLMLMSYPSGISAEEVEYFVTMGHPVIYCSITKDAGFKRFYGKRNGLT